MAENNTITKPEQSMAPSPHRAYAKMLAWGALIAFTLLIFCYVVYVLGVVKPNVPLTDVPKLWGLPVNEYLQQTNSPCGWGWIRMLNRGDFLNFVPIAMLGLLTPVCLITLIPRYVKARDRNYVIIVVLEIIVICIAASGLFGPCTQ